jgi:hypothetical protein
MQLSGYPDDQMDNPLMENNPATRRYKPSGHIRVWNTDLNRYDAVKRVKVKSRRWFRIGYAYTNDNGYFFINNWLTGSGFKKKAHIYVKFKDTNNYRSRPGNSGLKVWEYFFVLKKHLGLFSKGNMENLVYNFEHTPNVSTRQAMFWGAATTHNALEDMAGYVESEGVRTVNKLTVKIAYNKKIGSYTPMFHKAIQQIGWEILEFGVLDMVIDDEDRALWQKLAAISIVQRTLFKSLTDLRIDYAPRSSQGEILTTKKVYNTVCKQYAKAMHFEKNKNWFWSRYVLKIIINGGVGSTNALGYKQVALVEGFADFLGNLGTYKIYNGNLPSIANLFLRSNEEQTPSQESWIPYGFFHDLYDNGEPAFTGVTDNADGFTVANLYQALESPESNIVDRVNNLEEYKESLMLIMLNRQKTQVEGLLNQYYY